MSHFKATKPGQIEMELVFTLDLKDWIAMKKQIQEGHFTTWPTSILLEHINDMVAKAEKEFYPGE